MYVLNEKNEKCESGGERSSLEERASLGTRTPCPEFSLLYKWVPEGQELVALGPVLPFDLLAERRFGMLVVGVLRRIRVVLGLLDVVAQIIPVWKSTFGHPTPSARRCPRDRVVKPNSLVDFHTGSYARRFAGSESVSKASRTLWKASVLPVFLSGWYFSERSR